MPRPTTPVGLAALIFLLSPAAAQPRGPLPVIIAPVQSEQMADRIEALGTLRAKESARLSPSITDVAVEIGFSDGERVESGRLLLRLRDEEQQASLSEAQANLENARRQFERTESLAGQGAQSAAELDERRRTLEAAVARRAVAEAMLNQRRIVAPFSGILGLRNVSVGSLVGPGDVIAILHDDSLMKLDFAVPSTFLEILQPGLEIEARSPALDGHVFRGAVTSIDNQIDPVTRSIQVRAEIPNEDLKLRPGLLLSVTLLKNPRHTLTVPEEAISAAGNQAFLHLVDPDAEEKTARRVPIQTGSRNNGRVEVTGDISEGQWIVTHGSHQLGLGGPVTIRARQPGGESLEEALNSTATEAQ
jgi:membrane fusion protein, multidrug efflux system